MRRLAVGGLTLVAMALACSSATTDDGLLATGGSSSGGAGSGGGASAAGGSGVVGGAPSGGAASGGAGSTGGAGGLGVGGTTGGAASGGAPNGGTPSGGTATGGAASGGAENLGELAESLVGLRVDDPCKGTPTVSVGATCDHVVLTGAGFRGAQEVHIGGSEGKVYEVTLRVRGVVEPANVVGGERPSNDTFSYMNLNWRTTPLTLGGEVPVDDADYAQWRITVADPEQTYFLNDYQRVGHYVFNLDYEVVIPMAANTKVTLEAIDNNERLILNYEDYAPEGVDASVNHGQFIELDVVSVIAL